VSLKRTTADAELGSADALGAGKEEALGGGGAAMALTTGGALGGGAAAGGGGSGTFSGGALGGSASGSGAEALGAAESPAEGAAEAEACGAAEAEACGAPNAELEGAALADARPEAPGAAVPALAATGCACTVRPPSSPITKHSPMLRNRSPPTRAVVFEVTEDLTLEQRASVTGFATASTIRLARTAPTCAPKPTWCLEGASGNSEARVAYAAPMTTQHPDRVVLHFAGNDRPGVTARLAEVIAEDESAQLINIGQSVLDGYLMLSAIVDVPRDSNALRKLLFAATEMGLRFEVAPFPGDSGPELPSAVNSLAVTVLGPLRNGAATASIASFMAKRAMNIREIRSLRDQELDGLELIVDLPAGTALSATELSELRGHLLRLSMGLGVDLAVQRDDMFRRSKRLVCMDVDSTFVKGELIDELAELAGCKDQVAGITARAMRGEIDFKQALAERVQLLEGLPFERARSLIERFELTPGADRFVKILHSFGFHVGLVSGGFTFFVDELKARFGLDFAFANELEVSDGKLTGKVRGTIVDGPRKAQILKEMAQFYTCRLEQTVAIGDGANDILMLQTAGLGIAFRAKQKLQEVADMSLNHNERLDTLLHLMGFNSQDLRIA